MSPILYEAIGVLVITALLFIGARSVVKYLERDCARMNAENRAARRDQQYKAQRQMQQQRREDNEPHISA